MAATDPEAAIALRPNGPLHGQWPETAALEASVNGGYQAEVLLELLEPDLGLGMSGQPAAQLPNDIRPDSCFTELFVMFFV